jgi:hypothetical protein
MFDFTLIASSIEEETARKVEKYTRDVWMERAKAEASQLAHRALMDQIDKATVAMSLLEVGTKEYRYARGVVDELHTIDKLMPLQRASGAPVVKVGTEPSENVPWRVINPSIPLSPHVKVITC